MENKQARTLRKILKKKKKRPMRGYQPLRYKKYRMSIFKMVWFWYLNKQTIGRIWNVHKQSHMFMWIWCIMNVSLKISGENYWDTVLRISGKKIKVDFTSQIIYQNELGMDNISTCKNATIKILEEHMGELFYNSYM